MGKWRNKRQSAYSCNRRRQIFHWRWKWIYCRLQDIELLKFPAAASSEQLLLLLSFFSPQLINA